MPTLPALTWIGNAAAVLLGTHGAITAQTHQAGCSRQAAYDHADRVLQAVADAQLPGPSRGQLLDDNRRLRLGLQQPPAPSTPALDPDIPRRLAVTAAALGLSLNQIEDLLALLPPPDAKDRSTIGRWVQQAACRAGHLLAVLDAHSRPLAETLCPDEIFFHGRPVLVGVEPASFALLLCQRAADRTGPTWAQALRPFVGLRAVVRDAGTGLSAGLALFEQGRPAGTPPLDDSLDVFHTEQEAQRRLAPLWRQVEKHWAAAEEADRQLAKAKEQGRDARGVAALARAAWRKAFAAFACYEQHEGLWRRAKAALGLFRADGRLNDRRWAEAELAAVCAALPESCWKKLRGYLQDRRTLNFLDRLHRRLAEAEPRAAVREAVVELWRLEHGPGRGNGVALAAVQVALCGKLAGDWEASYRRVRVVLGGVVRASSAVECVNSVLRMQQARHRTLTQPLLDLKRLYWNRRRFVSGKRRQKCPYEHLGLSLPTYDFWELLHMDPKELDQQLSTTKAAA